MGLTFCGGLVLEDDQREGEIEHDVVYVCVFFSFCAWFLFDYICLLVLITMIFKR